VTTPEHATVPASRSASSLLGSFAATRLERRSDASASNLGIVFRLPFGSHRRNGDRADRRANSAESVYGGMH
jgi:hypothetical protein